MSQTGVVEALRQATADLIAAMPTPITLHREGSMGRTASGGQSMSSAPIDLPVKERFFQNTSYEQSRQVDWHGKRVDATYILVGMPDDEMEAGDTFQVNDHDYTIVEVSEERTFETKGYVLRNG